MMKVYEEELQDHEHKCEDTVCAPDPSSSSMVELEEDFDVASAFAGAFELSNSCGKFKGDWYDHFYNVSTGSDKNVLYLYPGEDHNNAFRLNNNLCSRLRDWYNSATSVHVYHVHSVSQA